MIALDCRGHGQSGKPRDSSQYGGLLRLFEVSRASLQSAVVPVLAIIGEYDDALRAVKRMVGVVPTLEVVEIAGASHATRFRPSASHLVAFLDSHRLN